ncbi:MAG: dihydroorotase [candidate division KSB1 bacterium]|nr:dihydroorotase [candidate division KSB1 bacterium]
MNQPKPAHKVLFKGATLLDLESGKESPADLLIVDGVIAELGKLDIPSFDGELIDASGTVVVPGLMDMHVHLREPGREDEETVESGCRAAMAGGFTAICPMPNTEPPADKREVLDFLRDRARGQLVELFPIAAVSKGRKGEEIAEMGELVDAGAVAFSDDGDPVHSAAVMRRALEYAKMFGRPVIDHCEERSLTAGGAMNEGFVSTNLGLPGMPAVAEEIVVARDLALAKYTGGRLHVAHVSTAGSVELIRRARAEGVQVTCEVTPHHLILTDQAVVGFDTNTKMNPPLRTAADVEALRTGLRDGTIQVIASDHAPHAVEEKDVEYAAAPFGIIGLETSLGLVLRELVDRQVLTLAQALRAMSAGPRQVLGLEQVKVEKGARANLTFIDPHAEWVVDTSRLESKCRNTPFAGWKLRGRVFALVNRGLYWRAVR